MLFIIVVEILVIVILVEYLCLSVVSLSEGVILMNNREIIFGF